MNKSESKYFNTAVKMDKALLALLAKKDFEYITIKEICASAGVNRSTFYLHYDNTRDLLKETTKYVLEGFLSYFSEANSTPLEQRSAQNLEDFIFITPEYVVPYLTYIKDNQRIFKTVMKHIGTMGFEGVYNKLLEKVFAPVLDRFGLAPNEREYILKFYLTGVTAISMEWLKNDCKEPIERISSIICDCILGDRGRFGI